MVTVFWNSVMTVFLQTINFFNLGSKLCLVDLPGYGFAYAKEEVKDAWEELVSIFEQNFLFLFVVWLAYIFFSFFGF